MTAPNHHRQRGEIDNGYSHPNEHGFTEQEAYDLEGLIDRRGIEQVLQQISEICGAKAEHAAREWQDAGLARRWATVAGRRLRQH